MVKTVRMGPDLVESRAPDELAPLAVVAAE